MADEVMTEEDFPCPCGKGVLCVQVLEHDTWVSGQHTRWIMRCDDCKENYRKPFLIEALVKREHHEEIERRHRTVFERRQAVGNLAANRYLPKFRDYVKSLKFKTAMHDAIGGHISIQKFREETRFDPGLNQAVERGLRQDPLRALKQIGVEDAEITAELAEIEKEVLAVKKFIEGVPKFPIPDIADH
jgi:hypothetical protein